MYKTSLHFGLRALRQTTWSLSRSSCSGFPGLMLETHAAKSTLSDIRTWCSVLCIRTFWPSALKTGDHNSSWSPFSSRTFETQPIYGPKRCRSTRSSCDVLCITTNRPPALKTHDQELPLEAGSFPIMSPFLNLHVEMHDSDARSSHGVLYSTTICHRVSYRTTLCANHGATGNRSAGKCPT